MYNFTELRTPFGPDAIEWRIAQSGKKGDGKVWAKCLAYVTNRAIMDRLDEIIGPANWHNEYRHIEGGVLCGLSILIRGAWVTKWDGSQPSEIEGFKGGLSGSMKRAAVQWGIGRYLYDLPEGRAVISESGANWVKAKGDRPAFKWDPPKLPAWALPEPDDGEEPTKAQKTLLNKLMKSHHWTPDEVDSMAERKGKLTKKKAGVWIDYLTAELDKRGKVEKAEAARETPDGVAQVNDDTPDDG